MILLYHSLKYKLCWKLTKLFNDINKSDIKLGNKLNRSDHKRPKTRRTHPFQSVYDSFKKTENTLFQVLY